MALRSAAPNRVMQSPPGPCSHERSAGGRRYILGWLKLELSARDYAAT